MMGDFDESVSASVCAPRTRSPDGLYDDAMVDGIVRVRLATLKPHPLNSQIYDGRPVDDLVASIAEHGLLEPLVVTPDRTVLSGHRRLRALRVLGVRTAPARVQRFEDEAVALVEFNRSRRRRWSELYRELQVLLPRLQAVAAERRVDGARRGAASRHGLPVTTVGHRHGRARVYEEIGRISGLGRESARKLLRVFEAIGEGAVPGAVGRRLDEGEISLSRAYTIVRQARAAAQNGHAPPATAQGIRPLSFEPTDVWAFHKRVTKYDLPGEPPTGAPPPQAWERLIELLTEPGDLVLDPMAGTGTISRVAEAMGRRCLSFDLAPRGPGVGRHNLLAGPPATPDPPRLVILDPPYFGQGAYSRRRDDLGKIASRDTYLSRLMQCLSHCWGCLGSPGAMAVVMGADSAGGGIDISWEVGRLAQEFSPDVRRIWLPYAPHIHAPHRVARARRDRELLTLMREIYVVSRPIFVSEKQAE